jgi:uncharacterized protein (DUF302 family)
MTPIGVISMIIVKNKWLAYVAAIVIGAASMAVQAAAEMKPFVLASTSSGDVADKVDSVKKSLESNGFEIVGEYSPYDTAHIIVITNADLKKAGASNERAGYVAAQRVTITKVDDKVQVAYTNPAYMAAAYHAKGDMSSVRNSLKAALGDMQEFGPAEGMTADDLEDYHYTFGMEYFDEPYSLADYSSHNDAVAAVEKGLAAHKGGTTKVYRIDIPGTKQTLFGVSMQAGEKGNKYMDEAFIMNEIDFKPLRSTGHLPYEILVNGGEVEALHARFRIAMNFPDLSMMGANSFMNIMPSPDAIKEALTKAAGGKIEEDF